MSYKILKNNCCGLDIHKTWIFACISITDFLKRTEYKQARFSSFTKCLNELCDWLAKYHCTDVSMEFTSKYLIPVFTIPGNITSGLLFLISNIPSRIKETRPTADIRQRRNLVRYRFKLTSIIVGEKNHAHNCLTVSNLKLDNVFSDIFGRSSHSITEHILQSPGETFDVTLFVDNWCKTPAEEIMVAVDGAISPEQTFKLRQCLDHINELEHHKNEIERKIFHLSNPYEVALALIRTVPGFDKNPLIAIQVLSEIRADMSAFPTAKNLV